MVDHWKISRREALKGVSAGLLAGPLVGFDLGAALAARRVLPEGQLPKDRRLGPPKDLNGYFPFQPSETVEQWQQRAEYVRRQMRMATGLWLQPSRPPVEAVVHGKIERDGYTVEKAYFESFPGLYVTGNLYRPSEGQGPFPAILCPHGHWSSGRFHDHGEQRLRQELASGAERFEGGGRHPLQARCAQLARMGCLVFHYDMLGYADSVPITFEVAHRYAKQRPELSSPDRWGLFSAQAELRLQNVMGLQTFNSVRVLDWICARDDVDRKRVGVTGASGGGTQSFMITAIDDRITASFPAVMVSTAMQGGCTCENAPYLRIDTGNIEFAALAAPRPLGLSAANDWTRELEQKGLPQLAEHYKQLGAPDNVTGKHFDFPHNYNHVSRTMMYDFFNQHFGLGHKAPVLESEIEPLSGEELTVWNQKHPKPASDTAAEVALLQALDKDAQQKLAALTPKDESSLAEYRRVVGGAVDVMIGRRAPGRGTIEHEKIRETEKDGYKQYASLLRHPDHGEELPTVFLYPNDWFGQVVVWIDPAGKSGLFAKDGSLRPAIAYLVQAGAAVVGVDLLYQGEFLPDGKPLQESPKVQNPRQAACYTLGYNHPLFAQRVHDVLSALSFARSHESEPRAVHLAGFGEAGPWVAAACAQAGDLVDKVAVGTGGFRFASITHWRDVNLLPGIVKFGDLPALLALCAPHPLWLADEGARPTGVVAAAYQASGKAQALTMSDDPRPAQALSAAKWLVK